MLSSLDRKQLRKFKTKKWREQRWVEVTKSLDWSMHLFTEIIGLASMWDQPRSCRWLNLFVLFFLIMKVTSDSEILFESLWHLVSAFFYWSAFLCRINHQYTSYKYLLLLFISLLCTRFSTKQRPWENMQAPLVMFFYSFYF